MKTKQKQNKQKMCEIKSYTMSLRNSELLFLIFPYLSSVRSTGRPDPSQSHHSVNIKKKKKTQLMQDCLLWYAHTTLTATFLSLVLAGQTITIISLPSPKWSQIWHLTDPSFILEQSSSGNLPRDTLCADCQWNCKWKL